MDINKTGYINRAEFKQAIMQLVQLKNVEMTILYSFLDDKNAGKIAIMEFLKICLEMLN